MGLEWRRQGSRLMSRHTSLWTAVRPDKVRRAHGWLQKHFWVYLTLNDISAASRNIEQYRKNTTKWPRLSRQGEIKLFEMYLKESSVQCKDFYLFRPSILSDLCELCSLPYTIRGHQHWNQVCPRGCWPCWGRHRLWHHQEWQWHLHCQVHSPWSRPIYHYGAVCWTGNWNRNLWAVLYHLWYYFLIINYLLLLASSGNSCQSFQSKSGSFPWCWQGESRGSRT